jgi:hypothetical protein
MVFLRNISVDTLHKGDTEDDDDDNDNNNNKLLNYGSLCSNILLLGHTITIDGK